MLYNGRNLGQIHCGLKYYLFQAKIIFYVFTKCISIYFAWKSEMLISGILCFHGIIIADQNEKTWQNTTKEVIKMSATVES